MKKTENYQVYREKAELAAQNYDIATVGAILTGICLIIGIFAPIGFGGGVFFIIISIACFFRGLSIARKARKDFK